MTRGTDKAIRNQLQAILDATRDLVSEVGIPETPEELQDGSRMRQLAFCECIRRTGEAVAGLDAIDPTWLSAHFADAPWRDIKATRNRLTHRYWTIDYVILYDIATIHLPRVTAPVARFLGEADPYADVRG